MLECRVTPEKTLFPDDAVAHTRQLPQTGGDDGGDVADTVHARIFYKHQKDVPTVRGV